MAMFEPVPGARFILIQDGGVERVVIPARRNYLVLAFLCLWLVGWAMGFIAALSDVVGGGGGLFLIVWLIGWTLGGGFAVATILWQLSGREYLAVDRGGLLHGWRMAGFGRERHYDLAHLSDLRAGDAPMLWGSSTAPSFPPFFRTSFGSVKWNYGARTLSAATGSSAAEGEMIVTQLKSRMPAAAFR